MYNNRRIKNSILLITILALLLCSLKPDVDKITRYMVSEGAGVFSVDSSSSLDIYNTSEKSAVFGIYKNHNNAFKNINDTEYFILADTGVIRRFIAYSTLVVLSCLIVLSFQKLLLHYIHQKDGKK